MKEQQETNNASPAVPVNLQMWPSAPREKEKERDGRAEQRQAAAALLQSTKRPLTSSQ